jgi:hypothetical protein
MKTVSSSQRIPNRITDCNTEFLSRRSTKVIIQETATRRYLDGHGLWTATLNQAITFQSGSAAMEHARQHKLSNVQLVLTRAFTVSETIPVTNSLLS